MRRKIIAGNWKMHKTQGEARGLIAELIPLVAARTDVDVLVCPPYTSLAVAREALAGSGIGLGAQDLFWKASGAYTGKISAGMLADAGAGHVIVGHSESRGRFGVPDPGMNESMMGVFGDNDSTVNRKLLAALDSGLTPICCVGETIDERRAGRTDEIVRNQTAAALEGVDSVLGAEVVFAYEPVWAIGTGEVCGSEEADRVCALIRVTVGRLFGRDAEEHVRIQYGGSVKPSNAFDLLSRPNIDGALVGGASLDASDFAAIVNACPVTP